jgi:hypothetical protein
MSILPVSPGPAKYDTRGQIVKPLPRILRKKIEIKQSLRYDPVDRKKYVPDPGSYKVSRPITKPGDGFSFASRHEPRTLMEVRKSQTLKRLENLPYAIRKTKLQLMLDEDTINEYDEPASNHYNPNFVRVWPEPPSLIFSPKLKTISLKP